MERGVVETEEKKKQEGRKWRLDGEMGNGEGQCVRLVVLPHTVLLCVSMVCSCRLEGCLQGVPRETYRGILSRGWALCLLKIQ